LEKQNETQPKRGMEDGRPTIYVDCFLPEYATFMKERYPDTRTFSNEEVLVRRTFFIDGETSKEAILEAINALAWYAEWIQNPPPPKREDMSFEDLSFVRSVAPEESDAFYGWTELMGITEVPKRTRISKGT